MTFGLTAGTIALIGAGASVAGSVIGANAAGDAADVQSKSAADANALQKQIYDQQRADQEPFRQGGLAAQNRLMTLLGLKAPGGGVQRAAGTSQGGMGMSGPQAIQNAPVDQNALRAQLLPQFTKPGAMERFFDGSEVEQYRQGAGTVDEAGLQAAIDAQAAQGGGQPGGADTSFSDENDPEFGSLMKDFTSADFLAGKDPGYDWRLKQGELGMERTAAARGGLYSGRALKDAANYNQGAASQEYGNAFNRFQTNRSNKLNPLQSLMGAGQTSANQVGQAGQNYGNQTSNNIIGVGNARGAAAINQGNQLQNGINQGMSIWQRSVQPTNSLASSGFGTGPSYGNQDYGQYL